MKAAGSSEMLANLYQNILRHIARTVSNFYSHRCDRHRSHSVNSVYTYIHTYSTSVQCYDCIIGCIVKCSVLNYTGVPEKRYSKTQ